MISNPWENLEVISPYVLDEDQLILDSARHNLRLEAYPLPFLGSLVNARVVFLLLNPGFYPAYVTDNLTSSRYLGLAKANLTHSASPGLYYLSDELDFTVGYNWWRRILRPLLDDGVPQRTLAERSMAIQYLGYHSPTYKPLPKRLPSQEYGFSLVRVAIARELPIVVMRSERLWLEAVPELTNYPYIKTKNVRNPVISRANLGDKAYEYIWNSFCFS